MPELTKKPLTGGYIDFCCRVPEDVAPEVEQAFLAVLRLVDTQEKTYGVRDVFPDLGPQDALKGARNMAGFTQQELGDKIGVAKSNISEMERGKRGIGKDVAKRLARVLDTDYRVFL